MTRGQARALEQPGERLLAADGEPIESRRSFGRDGPLGIEIGFGMGHALLAWAGANPDWNLLGVEIYRPGIGAALLGLDRESLANVRLIEGEAVDVLETRVAESSVDEIRVFFPDPWPKKRHHKRRLIQPEFIGLATSRLKPDGTLWLATDWQPYAEWMLEVLEAEEGLRNVAGQGYARNEAGRVTTRFEARGERLGHEVWDLKFARG